jgi:hypothetical protein
MTNYEYINFRLAEQLVVSELYGEYFNKSEFLANKLQDYFFGGIDDMATVRLFKSILVDTLIFI